MAQPFWFRELQAAGKGPDWIFSASFAPNSQVLLNESFRTLQPHGFSSYHATQALCPIHSRWCDYDLSVDNRQYQTVIAQLDDRQEQNMYVYHTLQACQNEFQLVRGYGGYPDQHGSEETRCIRTLAQTLELIMVDWSISYGGVTYSYEEWLHGKSSTELLQYLDKQASTMS